MSLWRARLTGLLSVAGGITLVVLAKSVDRRIAFVGWPVPWWVWLGLGIMTGVYGILAMVTGRTE